MLTNPKRVKDIFLEAVEQLDEAARAAYLDRACGGDAGLRDRVEALLRSHDPAGSFLGAPAVKPPAPDASATHEFSSVANPADEANEADADLKFLTPPGRPDSLGRLGHYEVLEVLGQGGFGIVFRAFDDQLQRVVAVKVLDPQLAVTSPARKRFLREARSSAKVRHENVVQVYAVEEQPLPYLVMEFIPGETLQQRLDRTGPLETVEVVQFGRQIAEGLAAAHSMGLIHRDIKPGNILIEAGANPSIKITDFGLARAADDASVSQSGLVAGTPMYMAPEQAQGDALDHRADLFSLGSVLYTMCSGRPPFRANSTLAVLRRVAEDTPRPIPEIIPEAPKWLCDLITRLHAKKPEDRFASAQEVADLLARGLAVMQRPANVPPAAVEKVPPPREMPEAAPAIRRPRFRARRWVAAAAVLLLLAAGGLGFTEATGVTDVHGTVIRLFSPEGTLEIAVDDPDVSVRIDGPDVVITGAGPKEIRLKPGNYTVEASKDGKVVKQQLVTVTKDGKQVVRVSREAAPSDTKAATLPADASAWEHSVAAMPAEEQVKAVSARLKELNPGFDGKVEPTIEDGVVTGLKFLTDEVVNIAPVRALKGLTSLDCRGGYPRKGKLSDLSPLKGMSLSKLTCSYTQVAELTALRGMPLTQCDCAYTQVADLAPLKGMPLVDLVCASTGVSDLSPLKGMKLQSLMATGISASDLTPLHGMPLKGLDLYGTIGVTNLQPLQGMPLEDLNLSDLPAADLSALKGMTSLRNLLLEDATPVSDAGLVALKSCKNLTTLSLKRSKVTAAAVEELRKALPNCKIEWDGGVIEPGSKADASEWERSVAAMPAEEQVKAVSARLKELNPGFDGKVEPTIENGVAAGLEFQTDHVSDITPVHVFTGLRDLKMKGSGYGKGTLADVTPLKGMPLTDLSILDNPAVADLSPLKGMPLKNLSIGGTGVTDLTPLKGMPLERLFMWGFWGSDLTPLKGMPLKWLNCGGRGRKLDLAPLAGLPLEYLCVNITQVSDLAPLKGMPLTGLDCQNTLVSDVAPLRGLRLQMLHIANSKVSDLAPIKGMPLKELFIDGTGVTDLKPLQGMPLEDIRLTPNDITKGLDILRDMRSLNTIGIKWSDAAWPAAEFWERYDKGQFKK